MLNFGASKPRVKGGPGPPGLPLDPHLIKDSAVKHKYTNIEINSRLYENCMTILGSPAGPLTS